MNFYFVKVIYNKMSKEQQNEIEQWKLKKMLN